MNDREFDLRVAEAARSLVTEAVPRDTASAELDLPRLGQTPTALGLAGVLVAAVALIGFAMSQRPLSGAGVDGGAAVSIQDGQLTVRVVGATLQVGLLTDGASRTLLVDPYEQRFTVRQLFCRALGETRSIFIGWMPTTLSERDFQFEGLGSGRTEFGKDGAIIFLANKKAEVGTSWAASIPGGYIVSQVPGVGTRLDFSTPDPNACFAFDPTINWVENSAGPT